MDIQKFLKNHYSQSVELKYRMFCICSALGTITSLLGFVVSLFVTTFSYVTVATFFTFLTMIILTTYGYKTKKIDFTVILMSCFLNIIVFPSIFLTTGALYSNVPIFFVMGIYIATPLLIGKKRTFLFILEILFYCFIISLCYFLPDISYTRSHFTHTTMLLFSFIIVIFYIFSSTVMISQSYQSERNKTQKLNAVLTQLALRDPLTQLYNRRYLSDFLDNKLMEDNENFSIVIIDIDDFKLINDTHGHIFGDEVLIKISRIMETAINNCGFACRFGGEEFMIYYEVSELEDVYDMVSHIKQEFIDYYLSNFQLSITFSAGIAIYRGEKNLTDLFNIADSFLYESKGNGKNQISGH